MNELVSVIMPVYNCEKVLRRSIQGILDQSHPHWELLIVDDGSTDGSGTLCDSFAAEDSRIRVLHKENGGVSSARNMGIANARGEYVLFCDSDDCAEPDWIRELTEAVRQAPDRLPVCNYYRNTPTGTSVNYSCSCSDLPRIVPFQDMYALYQLELIGTPWNKLYIREILKKYELRFLPDMSLGEDLLFNLDYLERMPNGITFIERPLYHYYLGNADSLSAKYYPDLMEIYYKLFARLHDSLCLASGALEKYERDFYLSFFYAYNRVFRNNWSAHNTSSIWKKWRSNRRLFHSEGFQRCRKIIKPKDINILQYWGLKSSAFTIYWATVVMSEAISRKIHR